MIHEKNAHSDEHLHQRLTAETGGGGEITEGERKRWEDRRRKGRRKERRKTRQTWKDVSTQQARGSGRQKEKHRDGLHGARLRN